METVFSPMTYSNDVSLVAKIPVKRIVDTYRLDQQMDISRLFPGIETIELYRCNSSGFEFFWPLTIAGDDVYYQELGQKAWYYHPDRWEHIEVIKELKNEKILEVGCGSGAFLKNVVSKTSCAIEALELNSESVKQLRSGGFHVSNTPVEEYAKENPGQFDLVCSFQVLEHVSTPYEFLKAQIELLKSGGKLIIGVPNNDSFIGSNLHLSRILNEPPHHMGRWTYESLRSLEKIFPELEYTDVKYEPMVNDNVSVYTWNLVHRLLFKNHFLTKAVWKLKMYKPFEWSVRISKNKIKGQTILISFVKR
ncbi:MAG: methyltransferase family protein [Fluviicola sp.]|jgi:2-polyprenyl-3-methyl-5-hydroxy-6-metoxy-1,4-benzoquinol methylase|uniref:class I SAM-dependent methyltransferase n=1 Tax=Fluviicola sp. TaxID=1917219 RepID=UPI002634AB5D|nr:class I SAM-dependent methyltransferase [Fluviicola sp.]MDF3027773.1 methyltransferase family protein [Fluviicola sp.]